MLNMEVSVSILLCRLGLIFLLIAPAGSAGAPLFAPHLRTCCDLSNDPLKLLLCIRRAGDTNELALKRKFATMDPAQRKRKYRFGIVTYATQNIWDYAAYGAAVNEAFAENNGHIFKIFDESNPDYNEDDSRWNKVKVLMDALQDDNEWTQDLDYIVWVDADLVFLDMFMDITKLARMHKKADIIVSAEHIGGSTLINSGSVIMRRSKWSLDFVNRWWSFRNRTLFSDQEQFDQLYKSLSDEKERERIVILPPDAINTDPPAIEKLLPHNQVLHLMGEHTPLRIKVFQSAFADICRHLSDSTTPLSNQLSVNRNNILKWSNSIYEVEVLAIMMEYEDKAEHGLNTLQDTKKLHNAVHHYCHGLKIRSTGNDIEVANNLRNASFVLALKNFNNYRPIHAAFKKSSGGGIHQDWPEHLKTVAVMGGHLVSLGTPQQRKAAVTLNMQLLNELLRDAHDQQKHAVESMIAAAQYSFAMIEVDLGNIEAALRHNRKQLEILERISQVSGEHILINPLESNGNMLSQLNRFKEAKKSFERAIGIAARLYGHEHASLQTVLLNGGTSLYFYGMSILRKKVKSDVIPNKTLRKAKSIMLLSQDWLLRCRGLLIASGRNENMQHLMFYLGEVKTALDKYFENDEL